MRQRHGRLAFALRARELARMLIAAALLLAGIAANDSISLRPIDQWAHKTWTVQQGAPAEIRTLAQTRDGYLWLGTTSGLVRFDGVQFVPFRPRGNDSLPAIGIADLLAGHDGGLWIIWDTGTLSHLVDGRLTNYDAKDGLPTTYQLAESSQGELVAGTATGLARFDNGRWKELRAESGFTGTEARGVWFDRSDVLWVEAQDRVVYRPSREAKFVDPGMPLTRVAYKGDFAQAKDGAVWMAELGRSAHTLRRLGDSAPLSEVKVGAWALVVDRKGSLWVGSRGDGLRRVLDPSRYRGRTIDQFGPEAEQFTERDGLLSNVITDLLEDREGSIWVASDRGLERFREGSLTPFATRGGLRPRAVFAARDSSVWISAYAIREVTRIGPRGRDDLHEPPCWCFRLAQDSSGDIWSFMDTTVVRFHGLTPNKVPLAGAHFGAIDAITIDPSGTIWLDDQAMGLVQVGHNRLRRVAPTADVGRVNVLFSDRSGRIWLGSGGRISVYDQGKLTVFGASDGVQPGQITDFYQHHSGQILAVGAGGIHRFENGRFRTLTDRQALPGRAVFGIAADDTGAWWVGTRIGVLRLEPGALERAFADTGYTLTYRLFDRLDGLPGALGMTRLPVVTRAADGKIWVAADEGVAAIDPRELRQNDDPLHVLIEAVRIDGRELGPSDISAIPPGGSNLEIDYTATALAIAERVRFRYRLEGVDAEWHDVGDRRRAYYTDLRPGSYTFQVSANNGDGHWVETGASWSFRVLPAWYQTRWFTGLLVLLISGIGAAATWAVQRRRHLRSQAELAQQYEAVMAERGRIADDLHDTLLQGFTGINLQLIAAELAIPNQPDVAAATLVRVQRLTEESLREARERVWEMRDAVLPSEDLATALEAVARDRTVGSAIVVEVTTAGNFTRLPRTLEDAAFRIGREAIANAVRHANPTRIEIHLELSTDTLLLEVRDNGRGMNPSEVDEARRQGHFGLAGIQNRAALLGGRCETRPRPGGGTLVVLELPLTQASASSHARL